MPFTITTPTDHGITMTSSLPMPVYRDDAGNIQPAIASAADSHTDFYVLSVISATELSIEFSGIVNVPSHGLVLGEYYFLSGTTPGSYSATASTVDQPIYYVIDADNIQLLDIRPIIGCTTTDQFSISEEELYCITFGSASYTPSTDELCVMNLAKEYAIGAIDLVLQNSLAYQKHYEYYPVGGPQLDGHLVDYPNTGHRHINTERLQQRTGTEILTLRNKPVWQTGLRIWVDREGFAGQNPSGSFGESTELTPGVDFYLDSSFSDTGLSETGQVHLIWRSWPSVPRSIKVEYYAGHRTLPAGLKGAVIKTIAHNYLALNGISSTGKGGLKTSESLGRYSYSIDTQTARQFGNAVGWEVPPAVMMMLQRYKSWTYRR